MEKAILVGHESPVELRELAMSAGAHVIDEIVQRRQRIDPAYYIGRGKAEEIRDRALDDGADLVIFDEELTPGQTRNLEDMLGLKVIDRTGLILDIFARRARTREGKLQVELAQLTYTLPRLAGRSEWLSRLGGGIGTRGPGETQLEVDRRRIRHRIARLKREIEELRQHRLLHRQKRRRQNLPMVSLVGYTNAGKSTLFRALSKEETVVSARLFSTLDTLVRKIQLGEGATILISDTVGFIRKLPHQLVDAFRATLEEVVESDLMVHVVDVADAEYAVKKQTVVDVLSEIGAGGHRCLTVYNKADLLPSLPFRLAPDEFFVSAVTGQGVDQLVEAIVKHVVCVSC